MIIYHFYIDPWLKFWSNFQSKETVDDRVNKAQQNRISTEVCIEVIRLDSEASCMYVCLAFRLLVIFLIQKI